MKQLLAIAIILRLSLQGYPTNDDCKNLIDGKMPTSAQLKLSESCVMKLKDIIVSGNDTNEKIHALNLLREGNLKNAFELFTEILHSVNSIPIQQMAIETLSEMYDKRVLPVIVEYLSSPYFAVRESVILALKKIGDDRMYPFIIKLATSYDIIHRIYALEALYHLYDERFYGIIVQLLKDNNKSVRYFALECVAHNQIIPALFYVRAIAINDVNEEVKVKAINVLSALNDKGAYYIFVRSLSDVSDQVREAAVDALSKFLSKQTAIYLSQHLLVENEMYIKQKIIKSLIAAKSIGDIRGFNHILSFESHPLLRIYSAYALGVICDERAVSLLITALKKDSDLRVRAEAANALGNFKGRIVVMALLEAYEKEKEIYVSTAIIHSLKKICDSGSLLKLFLYYVQEENKILQLFLNRTICYIISKKIPQYYDIKF